MRKEAVMAIFWLRQLSCNDRGKKTIDVFSENIKWLGEDFDRTPQAQNPDA